MTAGKPIKRRHLVMRHHWFDAVAAGTKRIEYRAMTPHYTSLLCCIPFPEIVVFHRGYTRQTVAFEITKIDTGTCPIPGWSGLYYRIHLGRQVQVENTKDQHHE